MKKTALLTSLVVGIFLLVSCSGTSQNVIKKAEIPSTPANSANIAVNNPDELKLLPSMTLLVQHSLDIDKDGKEEKVELYTNASKDDKGNVMWDDKNQWLLQFTKDDHTLEVFEEDIQLGKVDFWLYMDKDQQFHIACLITRGESIQMLDYRYNEQQGAFVSTETYSLQDINIKFYYK